MTCSFLHTNLTVLDLQKSLDFYRQALGLTEVRRIEGDGFTIVFLGDGNTDHLLELTHYHDRTRPFDLGDNEIHLAVRVPTGTPPTSCTRRWAVSALRTPIWVSTS